MGKNIYYRKDGRYEGRIYETQTADGKKRYHSVYGKTKDEVEGKIASLCPERDNYFCLTDMTVRELASEWLGIMSVKIKESTAANYRMKFKKHILPAFGSRSCSMLQTKELYTFIDRKLKEGLSVRYVSDILVLMKSVFRYAVKQYNIKNILDGIAVPTRGRSQIEVLSDEQQNKLKKHLAKKQGLTELGVMLTLYTGLRIGELCALKWKDIDLKEYVLNVDKTIQRIQINGGLKKTKVIITEPKSASSQRRIPIPECLIGLLKRHRNDRECYILSGKAKPIEPRVMQYRFVNLLKNADLPSVHFHSLRHAFASKAVALGFDIKTLSEILGHSSVELTVNLNNRYTFSLTNKILKNLVISRSAVTAERFSCCSTLCRAAYNKCEYLSGGIWRTHQR